MSEQAHAAAYSRPCRYCATPVLMAVLRTGRWRAFDPQPTEPGPDVHRFARGVGMVPAEGVPGYVPHVCEEHGRLATAAVEVVEDLRSPWR